MAYTETIGNYIKSFKRHIAGTDIKATTIRQAYAGYFIRFSDGTVCDIRIREEGRITIEPLHGGPKKTVSVDDSIIERDPNTACKLLEQKLGAWLASSEQDVFHAVQCHNQWALLEKIEQRAKSIGIKSTENINKTLLANMIKHGLIKKDSANCLILPEMDKDRFCQLLQHAAEEVLANVAGLANVGYDIEIEAGGRKYPVKILGSEVISAKDFPKSREGEIRSRIQNAIDKRNDEPKCAKCGSREGMISWSPFEGNKREFSCDACNSRTLMTPKSRMVSKFSDANIAAHEVKHTVETPTIPVSEILPDSTIIKYLESITHEARA